MIENAMYTIGSPILSTALDGIGDGAMLTFSSHEDRIARFSNVSAIDTLRFGNLDNYFTSVIKNGYREWDSEDQLRTKVSWTQATCICRDFLCQRTAAIDIFGVSESDNGDVRGYSPILLLDENEKDVPCLGHYRTAPIRDLDYVGCNPSSSSGGRFVERCAPGGIENLMLYDAETGGFVGRALNGSEVLPDNADIDPETTVAEGVSNFDVPSTILDIETTVNIPAIDFDLDVVFTQDIGPLLRTALRSATVSMIDSIGSLLRAEDFPPGKPASGATLQEFIRIFDYFSKERLLTSARDPQKSSLPIVRASPLYRDITSERPEASPIQDVISGIGLLFIASCALGASVGTMQKKRIKSYHRCCHHFPKDILKVFGALLLVGTESVAYYLRWIAQAQRSAYNESMAIVTVAGGGRFGGLLALRIGQDSDAFVATTYVIEVSDVGDDYEWVFIVGVALAFAGLVGSLFVGYKYDIE